MRHLRLRFAALGTMAVAVLAAACQDYTHLTDLGSGSTGGGTTAVGDTALPSGVLSGASTDTAQAELQLLQPGDSVGLSGTDDKGVRLLSLVLLDDSSVVWRSPDTLTFATPATSVSGRVALRALGDAFPYGRSLRAVVYAVDAAGNARYGDAPRATRLDPTTATGTRVTIQRGGRLTLSPGSTFGDVAFDAAGGALYYTDAGTGQVGAIDLSAYTRVATPFRAGARPSHLALAPATGGRRSELSVLSSDSRSLGVFALTGIGQGDPVVQVVLPIADVLPAGPRVAGPCPDTGPTRAYACLPSSSASFLRPTCTASGCTLFLGLRGFAGAGSVIQTADPRDADLRTTFSILDPARTFGGSALSPADAPLAYQLAYLDTATGNRVPLGPPVGGRSRCGTVFGDTVVAAGRDDGQGPLYVRTKMRDRSVTADTGCAVPIVRIDRVAGGGWQTSVAAGVQAVREERYGQPVSIHSMLVSALGERVLIRTDSRLLISDAELRVVGEVPSGATVRGYGFVVGRPESTPWVAVATDKELVIYDGTTSRALRRFGGVAVAGRIYSTLNATTGVLQLFGISPDRTTITRIVTSLAEIQGS